MDYIDEAQMVEECERREALHRFLLRRAPEESQYRDPERGKVLCLDCDEPIPAGRLAAHPHATRCIECQQDYDRELRYESRLYAA